MTDPIPLAARVGLNLTVSPFAFGPAPDRWSAASALGTVSEAKLRYEPGNHRPWIAHVRHSEFGRWHRVADTTSPELAIVAIVYRVLKESEDLGTAEAARARARAVFVLKE